MRFQFQNHFVQGGKEKTPNTKMGPEVLSGSISERSPLEWHGTLFFPLWEELYFWAAIEIVQIQNRGHVAISCYAIVDWDQTLIAVPGRNKEVQSSHNSWADG